MPEQHQNDWTPFAVGPQIPTAANQYPGACQMLTEVSHVTHQWNAMSITRMQQLRADLVYDDSRLNTERIRVLWLSPNQWDNAGGSRYGTVGFRLDGRQLLQGKRAYWIGSMAYQPVAVRLLLTASDYDGRFLRYDPSLRNGPWWYDDANDIHYWNDLYALEVMYEGDLPLSRIFAIRGIWHHAFRCNVAPGGACFSAGLERRIGIARFLASVIAGDLNSTSLKLHEADGTPCSPVDEVWSVFWSVLPQAAAATINGPVISGSPNGQPLAKAVLSAFARADQPEVLQLGSLFSSIDDYRRACADLVEGALGLCAQSLDRP